MLKKKKITYFSCDILQLMLILQLRDAVVDADVAVVDTDVEGCSFGFEVQN
jgi:hypothetical protein